ncbi:MAG: AAA family ATPase [Candidatus Methanomethylophilaceae archaeon]|jgi:dephospho-CoA kinase|nr:AAA family ATPase [Candidatus Methanomethylophilaceae archaeon]
MRMRLIIVAGMPGSGKEEFLTVARGMGVPFLRMGDIVREYHASAGPAAEGMTTGQFAGAERDRHGPNIWARRALERMTGEVFLVDGCRSMDEVSAYRELTPDVSIVGIHACPEERYRRLVKRAREDAPRDREEFRARDSREIGWGLAEVMALSDRMIVNDRSLYLFREDAKRLLRRMSWP